MTLDVNLSLVVQSLIVLALAWTAKTLWTTTIELGKLAVRIDEHAKRLDRLEDAA